MKLLLLDRDFHHKNRGALYAYKNIHITPFYWADDLEHFNLNEYDAVYSPTYPIDVKKYPNTKFIFGPHFSVFPENNLQWIIGPNTTYIQPSIWAADVWQISPLCNELLVKAVPFGVNTHIFKEVKPKEERTQVFVYNKTREPGDLQYIEDKLRVMGIEYTLFNYDQRYDENEYLKCLQNAKYGIWVGRHESQGFALEEALSCNVPLLVWDVLSMNQEWGPNYDDIPATAIPYWSKRCGEVFYKREHFEYMLKLLLLKLHTYEPREYILSNISIEKCEKYFIDLI